MSSNVRIALNLVASASGVANIMSLVYAFSYLAQDIDTTTTYGKWLNDNLANIEAAAGGAAVAALVFDNALKTLITDAADLQENTTSLEIAAHGTDAQIAQLSQTMISWADNSTYTTDTVAQMMQTLSEMGLTVPQIMNGAGEAAIQFGEAIGGDPVDATRLLAGTMQIFGYQGLSAAQVANLLTGAFYEGVPSATELRDAINGVGGQAAELHIPLQDTLTMIDMLTQAGLPATTAADGLRYMLRGLIDPTSAAAKQMKALGLSLFDTQGHFIGLEAMVDQLITHLKSKTGGNQEQMAEILGKLFNVRSGQAATILANLQHFKDHYNQIYGEIGKASAAKDANKNLSDLRGAWAELNTTITSFWAAVGKPLLPFFTSLVSHINQLVTWITALNPQVLLFVGIFIVVGSVLATVLVFLAGLALLIAVAGTAVALFIGVFLGVIVVAAIIAAIVVAVLNWGTITKWLHEQWDRFTHWFMGIVAQVGKWLSDHWNQALKAVEDRWNLGVKTIKDTVSGWGKWLSDTVENIGKTVVGWFQWLYDHNYYFKELVDFIHMKFMWIEVEAKAIWRRVTGWITGEWTRLSGWAKAFWADFVLHLDLTWTNIKNFAEGIWKGIVTTITNQIHNLQNIGGWIHDHVIKPITDLFTGIAKDAETWGKNLLTAFGNGLSSMAGWLKQQAMNALGGLAKILGFHSPAEEGPGADADTWAPNLMRMFTLGITQSTPALQSAALQASAVTRAALTQGLPSGFGASSGMVGGVTNVTVQVGNDPLFTMVMDRLTGQLQVNGFARAAR